MGFGLLPFANITTPILDALPREANSGTLPSTSIGTQVLINPLPVSVSTEAVTLIEGRSAGGWPRTTAC